MSWDVAPLGEIVDFKRTTISADEIAAGTTYVGLENLDSDGQFSNVGEVAAGELASAKFAFTDEHVLFGKLRPYLRKVARPKFGGVCSTDILPLLPRPILDRNYLFHALRRSEFIDLATARASGANLPRISPSALAELSIPLPPLIEQRRIAAILDKADALRAKRRAAIAKLDQLLQSVFLDMFGDPVTNPKGWPIGKIDNMLDSTSYGTSAKAAASGAIPVLRMNNITYSGEMHLVDLKYVNFDKTERRKYEVKQGDLLFNRTNSRELVGKTAVYDGPTPMTFAGYLVRGRTKDGHCPEYISAYLNSPWGKQTLQAMCKSIVGMANINAREFRGIGIPIPPEQHQLRFARIVRAIRSHRRLHRENLDVFDSVFLSLQQRAFAGHL